MSNYKTDLYQRYWKYQESQFPNRPEFFDRLQMHDYRPPVFLKQEAWRNVIQNPDSTELEQVQLVNIIPAGQRHRWFGSMNSSQALAQCVFGNLAVEKQLHFLENLEDDSGNTLFGVSITSDNFFMEKKIDYLCEPRQTRLDGFISGSYRIAIECKFTEAEIGTCSRPRLSQKDANFIKDYCDGTYSIQRKRRERCSLTEVGVSYWRYIPQLLKWTPDRDLIPCPLRVSYQLIRNILAVGVKPDGSVSVKNGHAVLIYDERNPTFMQGGRCLDVFNNTKKDLIEPTMLRKCSWQRIARLMRDKGILPWLTEGLELKYGI